MIIYFSRLFNVRMYVEKEVVHTRVDKTFSLHQIGSDQAIAEPIYF